MCNKSPKGIWSIIWAFLYIIIPTWNCRKKNEIGTFSYFNDSFLCLGFMQTMTFIFHSLSLKWEKKYLNKNFYRNSGNNQNHIISIYTQNHLTNKTILRNWTIIELILFLTMNEKNLLKDVWMNIFPHIACSQIESIWALHRKEDKSFLSYHHCCTLQQSHYVMTSCVIISSPT